MSSNKAIQAAGEAYLAGNLRRAGELCREALRSDPNDSMALNLLGVIHCQKGDFDLARSYLETALKLNPGYAEAHFNMAVVLQERGEIDKAVESYKETIRLDPYFVSAYYNLGIIFQEKRLLDEAIGCYRKALELDPNLVDALNNLGTVFQETGRVAEALHCFQAAIRLDPNSPDIHYNAGKAMQQQGRIDEAIAYYREALRLNPGSAETCNNLGYCLQEKGHPDDALSLFLRAVDLNPKFAEAYYNLALFHQDRNLLEKAIGYYEKAIACEPDFIDAHWNMACALLLSGKYGRGWTEYEWRWKLKEHRGQRIAGLQWDGADIAGRTILLHSEQGFGDAIQFIRYVPLVAGRGAEVVVQCPKELTHLFSGVEGVRKVSDNIEDLREFDLQCPLLSLPRIFGTDLNSIPRKIPYLKADPERVLNWKEKMKDNGPTLKVGLVWAGRIRVQRELQRSCPLDLFLPLARLDGVKLYSLQKDDRTEASRKLAGDMQLADLTEEIHDFSDTAALIENLDLVISIDTAAAHLAGALGKRVWTLLPFVPDWRWMLSLDYSPWYPTMRLFRQPSPGDWEAVMNDVERALRELVANIQA